MVEMPISLYYVRSKRLANWYAFVGAYVINQDYVLAQALYVTTHGADRCGPVQMC